MSFLAFVLFLLSLTVAQAAPNYTTLPDEFSCRDVESVLLDNRARATFTGRCNQYFNYEDAPRPDTIRLMLEDHRHRIEKCVARLKGAPAQYEMTIRISIGRHVPLWDEVRILSSSYWRAESTYSQPEADCIARTLNTLPFPTDYKNSLSDKWGYTVTWQFEYPLRSVTIPWTPSPRDTATPGELELEDE